MLIPLVVVGIWLATHPTVFRPKASGASIRLDPQTVSKGVTESFVVAVTLDPAERGVVATDLEINYDPLLLQVNPEDITTAVFASNPVKSIDSQKGLIKISLAAYNKELKKVTPVINKSAVIVTVSFKARSQGLGIISLNKAVVESSVGENILASSFAQVSVHIKEAISTTASLAPATQAAPQAVVPNAVYETSPKNPKTNQQFTLTAKSQSGKVNNPAFLIDGQAVAVEGTNGIYSIVINGDTGSRLSLGRHIVQLAGGCPRAGTAQPDCSNANLGFNPFQVVIGSLASSPATAQGNTNGSQADIILMNWGQVTKDGDQNGDGVVDSKDFALIYNQLNR